MHRFLWRSRALLLMAVLGCLFILTGCGGGSDSITPGTPPTSRVRLTINWAERTRNVSLPTSALSAVVKLPGANTNGGDVVFTIDRDNNTAAHAQVYESNADVYTGQRRIEVTFFADPQGNGSVVATASATVRVLEDGTIQDTITNVQQAIAAVEVAPGQSLTVGEQKFLNFTARRAGGEIVAVSAGSARFTVVGGGDKLSVNGVVGQGLAGGVAQVTVTVDNVISAPADVSVQSAVKIAYVANGQNPQVIAFLQLLQARNVTPTRFDAIPDPATLQQFDVLMVGASGNIGTADAPKVEAFLNAGKGVVLLGYAPRVLATGNSENDDTSSIASWFRGVARVRDDFFRTSYVRANPGKFPLPAGILPGEQIYPSSNGILIFSVDVKNPTVDFVAGDGDRITALAYELPSGGGRVYWQFHPYGPDSAYSDKVLSLLLAGTNWTAKR